MLKKNRLSRKTSQRPKSGGVGSRHWACKMQKTANDCNAVTGCRWMKGMWDGDRFGLCVYDPNLGGGGANKITSKRTNKKNRSSLKIGGWKSCEKETKEYDCSSRLECKWRDNACELDELAVGIGLSILASPPKGGNPPEWRGCHTEKTETACEKRDDDGCFWDTDETPARCRKHASWH
jgi:hypothetical protein